MIKESQQNSVGKILSIILIELFEAVTKIGGIIHVDFSKAFNNILYGRLAQMDKACYRISKSYSIPCAL